MKKQIGSIIIISAVLFSCDPAAPKAEQEKSRGSLEGTWELISGTMVEKGDTTFTDYTRGQKMIKIINATHFAFLRHDLNKGKDSAIYSSGGGSYTLRDSNYTETLEFCDAREWEGHVFPFKVSIKDDTLVQTGIEKIESSGIDRLIIETYRRIKE